jgi:hypothetical protein
MESAIDFINFWEKQQCNGKYYQEFNDYIRFLRGGHGNPFFDDLYNIYVKEHNLEYNKKQYDVCKFLANDIFFSNLKISFFRI